MALSRLRGDAAFAGDLGIFSQVLIVAPLAAGLRGLRAPAKTSTNYSNRIVLNEVRDCFGGIERVTTSAPLDKIFAYRQVPNLKVARLDPIQARTSGNFYDVYRHSTLGRGIWNPNAQVKVGPGDVSIPSSPVETPLGKVELPKGSMVMGQGGTGNAGTGGASGASGELGISSSGSSGPTLVLAPTQGQSTVVGRTSVAPQVAAEGSVITEGAAQSGANSSSPIFTPSLKVQSIPGNSSQLPMTLPGAFQGDMVERKSPDEFVVVPGAEIQGPMMDPLTPEKQQGPIGDAPNNSNKQCARPFPFNPFSVRDYQEAAIQAFFKIVLEGKDRGLIVLPTGTGKTITFADLVGIFVAEFPNSLRTLVISHREEILGQNAQKIGKVIGEDNVGIVQGEQKDWDKQVVMASIQTIIQENPAKLNNFDLIVLDEAHHYVHGNAWFTPLIKLGFFTPEGKIQHHPNRLLVGFTATPDRFTGKPLNTTFGIDGLIFEKDVTWMIERGHLLTPVGVEVNLKVPGAINSADALKMASPEEKARVIRQVFWDELYHDKKFQRTVVFVAPRADQKSLNEVEIVTKELNDSGIRAAGITDETVWMLENNQLVKVNGAKAANARKEVIAALKRGEYDALVNVNIATEGYDDPGIEAVVVARALESRGMFVQIVGRALRPDPNHPEKLNASIIDLGENFTRHRLDLNVRKVYEAADGELKRCDPRGTKCGPSGTPTRKVGQSDIEDFEVNDFGELVPGFRRSAFSIALEELLPTPVEVHSLAYRLGKPSDILFRYYNSNSIPSDFEEVTKISQATNDTAGKLLDAWATDQANLFAKNYPIPDSLSEGEKNVLNLARWGFFRNWRGIISESTKFGTTPGTIRSYLEEGKMPSERKQKLYQVLVYLISKYGEEAQGWEILHRNIEGAVFGDSWYPNKMEEFKTVQEDQLKGLRHILRDKDGNEQEVILLQFRQEKNGILTGVTVVRPGEEKKDNSNFSKIQIRYLEDGKVEVEKAWGRGSEEVIEKLKESTVYKEGQLRIRSRGWLRMGKVELTGFYLNDLPDMRDSDLEGFRQGLQNPSEAKPEVILLQFSLKKNGLLRGFTVVRPGEENSSANYGKIQIRYFESGHCEVEKGWGQGMEEVIKKLKESGVYREGRLTIRSWGWLKLREGVRGSFSLSDLSDMRGSDIENFRQGLKDSSGNVPEVILLQFQLAKNGALRGFTVVRPGEEKNK
jgi:superfamily II DNA or RNA helicase